MRLIQLTAAPDEKRKKEKKRGRKRVSLWIIIIFWDFLNIFKIWLRKIWSKIAEKAVSKRALSQAVSNKLLVIRFFRVIAKKVTLCGILMHKFHLLLSYNGNYNFTFGRPLQVTLWTLRATLLVVANLARANMQHL